MHGCHCHNSYALKKLSKLTQQISLFEQIFILDDWYHQLEFLEYFAPTFLKKWKTAPLIRDFQEKRFKQGYLKEILL